VNKTRTSYKRCTSEAVARTSLWYEFTTNVKQISEYGKYLHNDTKITENRHSCAGLFVTVERDEFRHWATKVRCRH